MYSYGFTVACFTSSISMLLSSWEFSYGVKRITMATDLSIHIDVESQDVHTRLMKQNYEFIPGGGTTLYSSRDGFTVLVCEIFSDQLDLAMGSSISLCLGRCQYFLNPQYDNYNYYIARIFNKTFIRDHNWYLHWVNLLQILRF
ncbi:unnamed protein product [Musa acuminata subsp. burmannicoides]